MIYSSLAVLLLAALFVWAFAKRANNLSFRPRKVSAYKRLLRKTRGDSQQAERLIEHERKRHPQWDRDALIQSAIEAWDRSNH